MYERIQRRAAADSPTQAAEPGPQADRSDPALRAADYATGAAARAPVQMDQAPGTPAGRDEFARMIESMIGTRDGLNSEAGRIAIMLSPSGGMEALPGWAASGRVRAGMERANSYIGDANGCIGELQQLRRTWPPDPALAVDMMLLTAGALERAHAELANVPEQAAYAAGQWAHRLTVVRDTCRSVALALAPSPAIQGVVAGAFTAADEVGQAAVGEGDLGRAVTRVATDVVLTAGGSQLQSGLSDAVGGGVIGDLASGAFASTATGSIDVTAQIARGDDPSLAGFATGVVDGTLSSAAPAALGLESQSPRGRGASAVVSGTVTLVSAVAQGSGLEEPQLPQQANVPEDILRVDVVASFIRHLEDFQPSDAYWEARWLTVLRARIEQMSRDERRAARDSPDYAAAISQLGVRLRSQSPFGAVILSGGIRQALRNGDTGDLRTSDCGPIGW